LIWVLWLAVGVGTVSDAMLGKHRATERSPRRMLAFALCLVSIALPAYLLIAGLAGHDRSHDSTARAWDALLSQPIPRDAILITNDRDEMMPQWYLSYVEGRRIDITGLFPLIQPTPEWADIGTVTDQALRSGRPVYLIKPMAGLEVKFNLMQEDALVRVDGPAASAPPAQATGQTFGDAIRLVGYDVFPDVVKPGGDAKIALHWQPITHLGADYTTFVHLLNANGDKIAQSDHRPGGAYYPTSLWKPGETLVDRHTLTLPADLGPAPYSIVVGLYDNANGVQHLGEPQQAGNLGQ
jgi:hypothetical protein